MPMTPQGRIKIEPGHYEFRRLCQGYDRCRPGEVCFSCKDSYVFIDRNGEIQRPSAAVQTRIARLPLEKKTSAGQGTTRASREKKPDGHNKSKTHGQHLSNGDSLALNNMLQSKTFSVREIAQEFCVSERAVEARKKKLGLK